jgi:hypothetical protein
VRPEPAGRAAARRLLDAAWRVPFVLAATLMVASGAAQSLGRTGVPALAAVVALGLAALGSLLGLLALRTTRPQPTRLRRLARALQSRKVHR